MLTNWAVPINEDEDGEALLASFVEFSARYPGYSPEKVGEHVFRDLVNPGFRGQQAGAYWAKQLEVQERIAEWKRTGGKSADAAVPTKEELVSELIALARDPTIDAKDRNTSYRTALEALGHITKQVDKTVAKKPSVPSAIIFRPVDFNTEPAAAAE